MLDDNRTVQLNVTYVSGNASVLRYAWKDYPTMVVYALDDGRPAAPFNITIPYDRAIEAAAAAAAAASK